jgi:hypothetical protein
VNPATWHKVTDRQHHMSDRTSTTARPRVRSGFRARAALGIATVACALGASAALTAPAAAQEPIGEYWFLFESRLPSGLAVQTTSGPDCWSLFGRSFPVPGRVDEDPGTALQRVAACGPGVEQRRTLDFSAPKANGAAVSGLATTLALRPGDAPRLDVPLRPDGTPRWAPFPGAAGGGLVCTSFEPSIERRGSLNISRIGFSRDPRCANAGAQPGGPPVGRQGPPEPVGGVVDFLEVLGDTCRIWGGVGCDQAQAPGTSDLTAFTGDDAYVGVNDLTIRVPAEGVYSDVSARAISSGSGRLSVRHRSREVVGTVSEATTLRGQRVGDPLPAPARDSSAGSDTNPSNGGDGPTVDPEELPSQGAAQADGEPAGGAAWRATERRWTDGATRPVAYDLDFSSTDAAERNATRAVPLTANVRAAGRAGSYAVLAVSDVAESRPVYDAALELGRDGRSGHPAQANDPQLRTPLAQLSGLSASASQSCVGYLAASARGTGAAGRVDFSAQDTAWRLQQAGTPPVAGLTDRFLSAASGYSGSRTQCKGFARSFASAVEFAATGAARGRLQRRSSVCVYSKGNAPSARISGLAGRRGTAAEADPSGCAEPLARTGDAAWITVPAGGGGARGTVNGDYITGDRAPDVDTITAAGGPDIVHGGPRGERVLGGSGDDALSGRGGRDVIETGSGDDSADGGAGNDRITAQGGINHLDGGAGADVIASRGGGTDTLAIGGPGNDRLIAAGSRTNMWGGPGNDVYDLRRGRAETVEMAGEGRDTIRSWVSARLAPNVEILRLQGRRKLRATGTPERDVIIGNRGPNVIDGGAGRDRLIGGPGNDTIILAGFGYETATGGPGRDRFELRSMPVLGPRGGGLERPATRTAHRITDFRVGQDQLVLRAREVGPEVLSLRGAPQIVQGQGAAPTEPTPTIAFDTASKLVTYDADGTGPKADVAVAVLPGVDSLPARALSIRG